MISSRANLLELQEKIDLSVCLCSSRNFVRSKRMNDSSEVQFILSGPTFTNNKPHIGTLVNILLKDSISKLYSILGKNYCLLHGFDMHGVPVERKVMLEKGFSDKLKFVADCKETANFYKEELIKVIRSVPSLTVHHEFYSTDERKLIVQQLRQIYKLYEEGCVVSDHKHVNFCFECNTFLAMSELESHRVKFDSLFFKVSTTCGKKLVVWTTTIYSIPYNQAVFFGNLNYVEFELNGEVHISSQDFCESLGAEGKQVNLAGVRYVHPIYGTEHKLLFNDCVTSKGTGLLHASADMSLADRNMLELEDIKPTYNQFINGRFRYKEGWLTKTELEVEVLKTLNVLSHSQNVDEKVVCWRCKTRTAEILSKQWFVDIQSIREKLAKRIENIAIFPEGNTLRQAVQKREFWCISRQRYWGVFIPAYQCRSCDHRFMIPKQEFEAYVEELSSEYDWLSFSASNAVCGNCGSEDCYKLEEIMDVWLDSGFAANNISHIGWLVEGVDQNRGWFQSTVILNQLLEGDFDISSTNHIMYHGFVKDSFNQKISKSLGNGIELDEILRSTPTDILRLSLLTQALGSDIILTNQTVKTANERYIAIRNNLVFLAKNASREEDDHILQDTDFELHAVSFVSSVAHEILSNLTSEKFNSMNYLLTETLSLIGIVNNYILESTKDKIFHEKTPKVHAMNRIILQILTLLLYPILPTTCSDIINQMNFTTDLKRYNLDTKFMNWFVTLKHEGHVNNETVSIKAPEQLKIYVKMFSKYVKNLFFKYRKKIILNLPEEVYEL